MSQRDGKVSDSLPTRVRATPENAPMTSKCIARSRGREWSRRGRLP